MTTGPRTAAEVRRQGNRLRDEASLYLRQHAANPVDWYPWGEEALGRARAEDRPIFLSSGYSSCHWCHVMEHEVFERDDVAEILNRHFVSIKVDREESPAVDATYMDAVQLLTGRGGWPMSVFLTPDLKPFYGGTYFPHDQFLGLIGRIGELWTTRRADLERQAGEVAQRLIAGLDPAVVAGEQAPGDELLAGAVAQARERWDERHGGLAGAMKFPVPPRWRALLHWYWRTGDPTTREMLVGTLEAMARGGLRDHLGGGFHRYTVDAHWTVPHFEKMLYDNAQLATLYLEAGAALGRDDFTAVGVDTLEFLDREMSEPDGACYASFDADSGGEEGTYYVWTPAQLAEAVGAVDGGLLADLLGVDEAGNFEHGASVLTRRRDPAAIAARHGADPQAVAGLFALHRETLRAVRARRTPPGLDRKIITAWNGLALSAFARGAMRTGRSDFAARARAIARYLGRVHAGAGGRLWRASNAGRPVGEAVLEDHAQLAQGLLDLFQLDGDPAHLRWADELLATIDARFVNPEGGWFCTASDAAAPLGRKPDLFDNVTCSGASCTLDAMASLAAITGREDLRERALAQVRAHAGLLQRAGLDLAGWLSASLRLAGPLHTVVVAGDANDPATGELLAAAADLAPGTLRVPVPATGASEALAALAPAVAAKAAAGGRPAAYVCRFGACEAPVHDPASILNLTRKGWRDERKI